MCLVYLNVSHTANTHNCMFTALRLNKKIVAPIPLFVAIRICVSRFFLALVNIILLDDKNYSQAFQFHISDIGIYQHTLFLMGINHLFYF